MTAEHPDLSLALKLCDLADAITLRHFRAADLVVETKPDMTPVSEADRAVEQALREQLAAVRPDDAVVGEEFGASGGEGARRWILDPIDGTKGYVRGVPVWGTLIALEAEDELRVGAVSAPALRRRWWAVRGGGAFVDDGLPGSPRRLRVSAVSALDDAQFVFGGVEDWAAPEHRRALIELGERCWRTRGLGDLWSYMLVAEGAAEIAADPEVSLWDLAAMQIIVEEAGGRFSDFSGARRADGGSGVATNGLVHDAALAIVGRAR